MPVAVNQTAGQAGGGVTSLTTGAVTPGGSDRYVLAASTSTGDGPSTAFYDDGDTPVELTADDQLTISFTGGRGRTFRLEDGPAVEVTGIANFAGDPGDIRSTATSFLFTTGVDQADPADALTVVEDVNGDAVTIVTPTVGFTGRTTGEFIAAALLLTQFSGTSALSSVVADNAGTTVREPRFGTLSDGISTATAWLTGVVDGSGNLTLAADVTKDLDAVVGWRLVPFVLNEAAGGSTPVAITTSLSAAVQQARSAAATLSAALQAQRQATASLSGALQQQRSAGSSLQAALSEAVTLTTAVQAAAQARQAVQAAASAALRQERGAQAALNAALCEAQEVNASLSAAMQAPGAREAQVGAALQAHGQASTALQAALLQARSVQAGLSAYLSAGRALAADLSAALQQPRNAQAGVSAFLQAGTQLSTALDAALQASRSATAQLGGALQLRRSLGAALNATLVERNRVQVSLAAALLGARAVVAGVSAYLVGAVAFTRAPSGGGFSRQQATAGRPEGVASTRPGGRPLRRPS